MSEPQQKPCSSCNNTGKVIHRVDDWLVSHFEEADCPECVALRLPSIEYVHIDEVQALIAAAFEAAATAWFPGTAGMCQLKPENQAVIRALTPVDAAAVRDALLAAEREACARIAEDAASMRCGKCGHPKNNHPYHHPFVGVAVDVAATIRRRGDST